MLWLNPCPFLQRDNAKAHAEFETGVVINVTDEFPAEERSSAGPRFMHPKDVRHVDTSGRPQFTAIEERVIGINESRAVYQKFLVELEEMVPIGFWKHAKRLIFSYQKAISRKAKTRAILCNQGYSAGEPPSKLRPDIIRQDYGQFTHNWFLAEYRTGPLTRNGTAKARSYKRAKKARKIHEHWLSICKSEHTDSDRGYTSSHSVDYGGAL
jgi:hypothetical protein